MKYLSVVFIAILSSLCSCSTGNVKPKPDYTGIDPKAQPIYDEYISLSKRNNIEFHNKITVGFTNIKTYGVVGLCTWGGYFREIDIDLNYWNTSTKLSRMTTLFHEMSHCYCGRLHDFGPDKDQKYPEGLLAPFGWVFGGDKAHGYLEDGCPSSIMYPTVVDDSCVKTHYSEYTKEMFDRCDPY